MNTLNFSALADWYNLLGSVNSKRSPHICALGPSLRPDGHGDEARDMGPKQLRPPESFCHGELSARGNLS